MTKKTVKTWLMRFLPVFTVLFLALTYLYVVSPELRDLVRPHQCFFNQLTGMLCPACGGTRAMIHLLNGNIRLALKNNALAVFILPLVFYSAITVFRLAFDRRFTPADIRVAPVWIWSLFFAVIIFWIIRNISCFSFLSPSF